MRMSEESAGIETLLSRRCKKVVCRREERGTNMTFGSRTWIGGGWGGSWGGGATDSLNVCGQIRRNGLTWGLCL